MDEVLPRKNRFVNQCPREHPQNFRPAFAHRIAAEGKWRWMSLDYEYFFAAPPGSVIIIQKKIANVPANVPVIVHIRNDIFSKKEAACQEVGWYF